LKMPSFEKTWEQVTDFWGSVNLDEPDVIVDKDRAKKEMGDEIAFIDMQTKQIKVNYPNMSQKIGSDKLKPIEEHEVGHHKFCPYDLKTNLKLLNEADIILRNLEQAKYAENLFSDILTNTHIIKKGDKSIIGVYQKMSQQNSNSELWNLYMKTCEGLWQLPQKTLAAQPTEKVNCDAKKLEDIIKDVIYKPEDWPKGMRDFTNIIKDYLKKEMGSGANGTGCQGSAAGSGPAQPGQQGKQPQQGSPQGASGNTQQQKSDAQSRGLIDEHSPKDFAPVHGKNDKAGEAELERKLKGLANDTGKNPQRYKRIVAGSGLGSQKSALKWFYRDLASAFDVEMPEAASNSASEVPETYIDWDVHDEDKNLDIPYSLSQHGAIIPGHTTYQNKYKKGVSGQRDAVCPDLVICIDSSGSMPDPCTTLSPAVLSAMVAARKALSMDRSVAVINFSSSYEVLDFTRKKEDVDETLVKFLNGGTDIPGAELLKLVQKNKRPKHIIVISDTEIYNLNSQKTYLKQAIDSAKMGGSIFLINPAAGSSKALEKMGYDVHKVTDPNDLVGLTLKKTKSIYGG
jgi:hypothetical protein